MFSQKGLQKHSVNNWNERDVTRWLKEKGFGRFLRLFRDGLGIINQSSRDKLLAAIHELKLFGSPLPDEKHFRLHAPGPDGRGLRAQQKKRSLPSRPPNLQQFIRGTLPDVQETGNQTPELRRSASWKGPDVKESPGRKTPQQVLYEETEKHYSGGQQYIEKGEIRVHTRGLDEEYKTLSVTNQTTSKELVRMTLEQTDAISKDHNLFYIAVEIDIKKKDSSLPTSQMMLLANDARPLEIQSRQLPGEAKFHLKMRNGGLLRVHAGILSPGVTYKSVQIARQTTAEEVVKMVLSSYECDEPAENYVLVENSTDSDDGRVLAQEECPLQVQSQWKTGEQKAFTLARIDNKVSPLSQLQSDNVKFQAGSLHGPNGELHMIHEKVREIEKNSIQERQNDEQDQVLRPSSPDDKENIEDVRKRKTSIDALDLQSLDHCNQRTRKVSQIDKFRNKFHEFHRKTTVDESGDGSASDSSKKRKVSQIDVFRSKFLAYYSGKAEGPATGNSLNENIEKVGNDGINKSFDRKTSPPSSDGEDLPRFSSSPPRFLRAEQNKTNGVSLENERDENLESGVNVSSRKTKLSLADILEHSQLVVVTIRRQPGEDWGLELVHVTKTGSLMSQKDDCSKEEKVIYVLHNVNGQNSILSDCSAHDSSNEVLTPSGTSTPLSGISAGSSEHEMSSILGMSSHPSAELDGFTDEMRHMVHKNNMKRRIGVCLPPNSTADHLAPSNPSPPPSRPSSTSVLRPTNSLPQRPSSALAQWRTEGSPEPRPGVRIVGITEGGAAARSGQLVVNDLIVEISGHYVLNSPLEPVIAALQAALSVSMVVSRAQSPEPKLQEKEVKKDYEEDIKALTVQVQNLVTTVSEMQNDMKKKDDKIRSLKKMIKKNSGGKGKIHETVHVLV